MDPLLAELAEYKQRHPDFFPPETTAEQQLKVFISIKDRQKRAKEQKAESFKKLDAVVENKNKTPPPEKAANPTAERIYRNGKFLKYCITFFSKVWLNDTHILEGVLYTAANMRVMNATDALHLHVMGTTQSGKSDSIKASLRFVHPNDQLIKTFSPKYLFYADDELHERTIVFSDDTVFDPETASLYRNMLTSWFTGVTRGVVVNQSRRNLNIPPRVSLILTSVENVVLETDDAQDESRFLSLEVRRTPEQMKEIRSFIQDVHLDISSYIAVVHAIWNLIKPRSVSIHKKVERDIPIREFKRYLTLVQSHALLCNRDTTTDDDFLAIDNFLSYSKPMIDSTTPAFTRKEAAVLSVLSTTKKMNVAEIGKETGLSILNVYRALRGRSGTFNCPSGGLMAKEPRFNHVEERSELESNIHLFWLRP